MKTWKPKKGAKYYWIGSGHILKGVHKEIWSGSDVDESRHKKGECFRSRREAEWTDKQFNGIW